MSDVGSLAGCTVVVTRAAEQASPLVARLTAMGAEVVQVPLIRIVAPPDGGRALDEALADPTRYAWVVVTSPNGAIRLRDALSSYPPGQPRIAAVGPATAEALERFVDLVPDQHLAEGLLAALPPPPEPPGNRRLLLPQGDRARPVLRDRLLAAGWEVDAVVAYCTEEQEPDADVREQALAADALVLASGSAATSWVQAFGTIEPPIVVSIGPITTRVAREAGLKVDAEAADHTLDGLVDALSSCWQAN